jgi:hypothetical protein
MWRDLHTCFIGSSVPGVHVHVVDPDDAEITGQSLWPRKELLRGLDENQALRWRHLHSKASHKCRPLSAFTVPLHVKQIETAAEQVRISAGCQQTEVVRGLATIGLHFVQTLSRERKNDKEDIKVINKTIGKKVLKLL